MPNRLEERQDQLIARLTEDYATDQIEVEEFERRVELVEEAQTEEQLDQVASDLKIQPAAGALDTAPAATTSTALAKPLSSETFIAIMSGVQRRGAWQVPEEMLVVAVMGGVELDFRHARLRPGITRIKVFAMMGGIEITVPPGLGVEWRGIAIMGGFDHGAAGDVEEAGSDQRKLVVTGLLSMAGVHVKTRAAAPVSGEAVPRLRSGKG